ncbi:MAG: hypothetical protein FJ086_00705 [Deltaproteobacteria bacterium]|nr:hypothetical protein [Deltaproteobacteria bacterium]
MEAAFALYRPLYVIAGWDDPLNTGRGLGSAWVGAGLRRDLVSPQAATRPLETAEAPGPPGDRAPPLLP